MSSILFSILTPAVPSRISQLKTLSETLQQQIGEFPVEHLILIDNKRRTVGEKRDALLRTAKGNYVAFVDDDDFISEDYVILILENIRRDHPDVITFRQQAIVDGYVGEIEFRLGNPNEQFRGRLGWRKEAGMTVPVGGSDEIPVIKRNAWHVCAWRRELALQSAFPPINYGEDWAFAAPLCEMARTERHIPKVLHFYRHSSQTTEAPPPTCETKTFSFLESLEPYPQTDAFRTATGS